MQRHRHNVKVSKLLVGLRPYQAYTKRHPWYYANTDASFNPSRLILLSGDVETNPGPTRASESRNGGPQLNIYYQNVRSLKNKLSVLRSEAPVLRKFDVISLTETWLNSDVETTELQLSLSDYTVFRRDRCGRVGGGVMVAVKTDLMPRRRDDLETDCGCLVVQIGVSRAPLGYSAERAPLGGGAYSAPPA